MVKSLCPDNIVIRYEFGLSHQDRCELCGYKTDRYGPIYRVFCRNSIPAKLYAKWLCQDNDVKSLSKKHMCLQVCDKCAIETNFPIYESATDLCETWGRGKSIEHFKRYRLKV